ncbi:TonB family protein [Fusobacterium mortiferum]|uniref:TonB family protein n=1 Tax=Fusobacterium mortiferum TaxID=850 RepID=UPI00195792F8|nr:energy transducer TonB [Fusobacterium mortiferum]
MSNRKKGEINIIYFFIIAILIHLALFIIKTSQVKGDTPLIQGTPGPIGPVSVQVRTIKAPKVNPAPLPPQPKIEESKPEVKEIPKKEIIKPEVKSKIKDKKKKEKKKPKENIEKQIPLKQPITPPVENVANTVDSANVDENLATNGNFSIGTDGVWTAGSSEGIYYQIVKQIDPSYPIQAERIKYRNKVVVSARFLVGLNGEIEKIEITKSHKKFGFDDEVQKALKQWKFNPIYYKNKNIKVYFTKDFVFEPKK